MAQVVYYLKSDYQKHKLRLKSHARTCSIMSVVLSKGSY